MTNIVDFHSHILPDVDDGSPDLACSLAMAREASRQGITHMFATPHCFSFLSHESVAAAQDAFSTLKEAIQKEGINIQLYMGCEIFCMERWNERTILYLDTELFPTMNQTNFVLVEFTTWDAELEEIEGCIDLLLEHNWIPILAHIERYAETFASVEYIDYLRQKGCLCQLNLQSLSPEESPAVVQLAKELIEREMIEFIGSDAHNMFHRPPKYTEGLAWLEKHCSREYLEAILYKNAEKYIL